MNWDDVELSASGETETAVQRVQTSFRLDDAAQREFLTADLTLSSIPAQHSILIDEWQRMLESWDFVRRSVDDAFALDSNRA